jgi:hypothetical protein
MLAASGEFAGALVLHPFAGLSSANPIGWQRVKEARTEVSMTSLYANLEKGRPYILSVLRIVVALLFLEHGLQKYFGFPSAGPPMTPLL